MPECSGLGLSGDRDSDCACKCESGLSGAECQCPAGQVFLNGSCVNAYCSNNTGDGINCYVNGGHCGAYCSDYSLGQFTCSGYCDPSYCPEGSEWATKHMSYAGFGCVDNDTGLYCAHQKGVNGKWLCSRNKEDSGKPCCQSENGTDAEFAKCYTGTCDADLCKNTFGPNSEWMIIAARTGGCLISDNSDNKIYCAPINSENSQWHCQKEAFTYGTFAASSVGVFKNCTTQDIIQKTGNCEKIFESPSCTWGEWDNNLKRCVGNGDDGNQYSCDISGNCYIGKTSDRCAEGCTGINPNECYNGLCSNTPPDGTSFTRNTHTGLGGYLKQIPTGYLFFEVGTWGSLKGCKYAKTLNQNGTITTNKLCGSDCKSDCSSCKNVQMPECAGNENVCVLNAKMENNCKCQENSGFEVEGYCCAKGHLYHDGSCIIVQKEEGKCFWGSHIIAETDEFKAPEGSIDCKCLMSDHCMGKNAYGVPSCAPEFCSENSAG